MRLDESSGNCELETVASFRVQTGSPNPNYGSDVRLEFFGYILPQVMNAPYLHPVSRRVIEYRYHHHTLLFPATARMSSPLSISSTHAYRTHVNFLL